MPPNNPMTVWGNERTMNLNTLVLTNIQASPYFKVKLFEIKTYHEVIDEIYYKVEHLEPWEKGSRKTAGQTGMCGGVRGVGAGGIVSSAFCLLYKLFTLKLTKKQVIGLIAHKDSPYIRGLGFMYIRFTQPPADLWPWFVDYLDDEEEIDVKAGGGHVMAIGEMLRQWLVKLEWYATLFPRIPVPIQKELAVQLRDNPPQPAYQEPEPEEERYGARQQYNSGRDGRDYKDNQPTDRGRNDYNSRPADRGRDDYNSRPADRGRDDTNSRTADRGRDDHNSRPADRGRDNYNSRPADRGRDDYSNRDRDNNSRDRGRGRASPPPRDRERERTSASRRTPPRASNHSKSNSFERDLARERDRQQKVHHRSRSPRQERERERDPPRQRRSLSRERKDRKSPERRDRDRAGEKGHDRERERDRYGDREKERVSEKVRDRHADREKGERNGDSHKHSHKEKKDKHRDRSEKSSSSSSHKHRHKDKDYR